MYSWCILNCSAANIVAESGACVTSPRSQLGRAGLGWVSLLGTCLLSQFLSLWTACCLCPPPVDLLSFCFPCGLTAPICPLGVFPSLGRACVLLLSHPRHMSCVPPDPCASVRVTPKGNAIPLIYPSWVRHCP